MNTCTDIQDMIPDAAIKAAFMAREDIRDLPEPARELLWDSHLEKVAKFREWIAGAPLMVIVEH